MPLQKCPELLISGCYNYSLSRIFDAYFLNGFHLLQHVTLWHDEVKIFSDHQQHMDVAKWPKGWARKCLQDWPCPRCLSVAHHFLLHLEHCQSLQKPRSVSSKVCTPGMRSKKELMDPLLFLPCFFNRITSAGDSLLTVVEKSTQKILSASAFCKPGFWTGPWSTGT